MASRAAGHPTARDSPGSLCPRIGRVITPEFGIRWALRECRDASHMQWSQAAHVSPALSLEEQIVGGAGGGVVKCVGS